MIRVHLGKTDDEPAAISEIPVNSLQDWKPKINPGYTGNRHDDKPESLTQEQAAMLGFIAGAMMVLTLSLFVVGL